MPTEQVKNSNPNQSKLSHFKLLSLGIVAKDKEKDSKIIEVYLTEILPMHEGEINDKSQNITNKGLTDKNNSNLTENFEVSQERGITVTALWLGENNRVTAPNVKQGERVRVYTVDGTEQYWWEPCGLDQELRRTERVIWSWGASKESKETKITPDANNQVTIEMNTDDGHLTITSGKGNNEPFGFKFQINMKEGNFTFTDDGDNPQIIQNDSKNGKISFQNSKKSFIVLDGDAIKMKSKTFEGEFETVNVKASRSTTVDTPTTTFTKDVAIKGNETVSGTVSADGEVKSSIRLSAPLGSIQILDSTLISGIAVGSGDV